MNPRRSLGFRPDLSAWSNSLEDRTLLATYLVNTFNDQQDVANNATTVGSTVSLRDAVIVATNNSGASEIDLPVGTYTLGTLVGGTPTNVGTGELQVGNIAGQNILIKGLGTAANTIINQTVPGNRIFNYDNNQAGTIAGSLTGLTIQGATNVNKLFGGGAILAGGPGDSLRLTGCVVQNNSTSNGTLSIARNGGGIAFGANGNLTIANCVFSNNTAGGNANAGSVGGAIAFNNNAGAGVLTVSNTVFSNNSATGLNSGGGAILESGTGNFSITASTFTSNSAVQGGAIQASGTGATNINIAQSRFFGNSATTGSGIDNFNATITANDNWWGANAFPGATGTDTVAESGTSGGSIAVTTHLSLALSPASSTIATNSSTTLTAKVVSTSAPSVAIAGTALDGLNLTFAPGTLGSVNPAVVAVAGGTASTTFSSGSSAGTTKPTVSLDNGTDSISVTIVGAPTANAQSVNVAHDTATNITLTGSDPNGRTLTFAIATNPTHGTLSGFNAATGAVTYTPTTGYHGADSFTFTVNNGFATSSPATVSLTVATGVPTANPQSANVAFNTPKALTLTGTDNDVPALTLTFAIATNPTHGTLSGFNASTGAVTYTPTNGYHGVDSFTFTLSNGTNTSAAATVSLTVATGVPTANSQSASVNENSSVNLTLTGSDPDVPALPLTFAIAVNPTHGTLSGFNAATGAVTYTPTAGYFGPDTFQFTVNNGTNTSAPAIVSLSVAQVAATVSGTVGVSWGTAGTATLQTNADGLRLLPAGRNTDLPWPGINKLSITLSQAATLSPGDVTVAGINVASYGPVTISGSGTSYTITLAQPISAADRVTVTIGNAGIATYTRRLDVLPGDFNDDGAVTIQDAIGIRNEYLGFVGAVPTVFGDINGDGTVDVNDYNATRRLLGTRLP